MAHSPEGHYTFESAGGESASFESRTDISFDMWESDFRIDNGYVLRMRLAELDLIDSPAPSVVMPGEDKGAHPKLFAGKYIGPGMLAYHDTRRILLTYENTNGSVTAHDWLVDLAVGACLVIETNREKDKLPSVASGPMMYLTPLEISSGLARVLST